MSQQWDQVPIEGTDGAKWDTQAVLKLRLPQAVMLAEAMFGPRDESYKLLGVRFGGDAPRLEPVGSPEAKTVRLWLSSSALENEYRALHQLAHEIIHLLNPIRDKANVLEEGVAASFSSDYLQHVDLGAPPSETHPFYARAIQLVSTLERKYPGASRALREKYGAWSAVTKDGILETYPDTPPEVATELAAFK